MIDITNKQRELIQTNFQTLVDGMICLNKFNRSLHNHFHEYLGLIGYLLEFGHQYVRIYNGSGSLVADLATDFTEAMLPFLHFDTNKTYVYIWCVGQNTRKLDYVNGAFVTANDVFGILIAAVLLLRPQQIPIGASYPGINRL